MKSTPIADIILRPVAHADDSFLFELYAGTRAEEMALVPWSEGQKHTFVRQQFEAQRQHYQKLYPDATHHIILCGEREVGRMYVARLPAEIRIVDLIVAAAERNRGIGTLLLQSLMEESEQAEKPLRIYVESFNPSTRLFQRLGFVPGDQQGIHVLMAWSANPKNRVVQHQ